MNRPQKLGVVLGGIVALTLTAVTPALAQATAPPRSSGGLFGNARSRASDRNTLDFTVALSEAFDSELPPDLRSRVPQGGPQSGGYSTMLVGSADYSSNRRRTQIAGSAQTAFRYYERLDRVDAVSHSAGLGASVPLPKRATFQVNQTAAYSPSYLFQLFPTAPELALGEAIPAAPDYRVQETESYSYGTNISFALGSMRGSRVSAAAEYKRTDFQRQIATRPDLAIAATSAKFSHGIARNGAMSVQYRYRTGEFGFGGVTREHLITVGGEYSRPLSARRRAIFRFKVAPSMLEIPESASSTVVTGQVYKLQADASADYQFHRTWQVGGNYRRGMEYVALLGEPVFSDAARAELSGLVGRRIYVLTSSGYATGQSAITRGNRNLDTYTANARLRFAWTRSFALYTEYLYYHYDLRGQSSLAPDLPRVFEQHGVRVGLTLLVSAF